MNQQKQHSQTIRYIAAFLSLALFAAGVFFEKHRFHSLKDASFRDASGFELTYAATYNRIILKDGKLYDRATVQDIEDREKECAT